MLPQASAGGSGKAAAGRVQTQTGPSVSLDSAQSPSRKASSAAWMNGTGSGASGCVSMAVTKSASGCRPGSAIMLKGRVRSASQAPDAVRFSMTWLRFKPLSSAAP
jgi:hypothetical protein